MVASLAGEILLPCFSYFADSHSSLHPHHYSYLHHHTMAHCHSDANGHSYSYTDIHTYTYCHPYVYCHAIRHADGDSASAHLHSLFHTYIYPPADADRQPHSLSSACGRPRGHTRWDCPSIRDRC